MAISPIDFTINVPRPNLAAYLESRRTNLAGLQEGIGALGQGIGAAVGTIQQAAKEQAEREAAIAQREQFASDLQWYQANPSKENFATFLGRNMWASKAIESIYGAMQESERKAELDWLQPVRAALQTKNPEVARDLMMQRYTALGESGKYPEQRKFLDNLLNMVTQGGEQGANTALATLIPREAALLNANNPQDVMAKLPEVPFATAKAEAGARIEAEKAAQEAIRRQRLPQRLEIEDKEIQSRIDEANSRIIERGERLNIDGYKAVDEANARAAALLNANKDIPKAFIDKMIQFQDNAAVAGPVAAKAYDLAIKFQTTDMPSGMVGRLSKWFDEQVGVNDAKGALRKEYEALTTDQTIAKLGGLKGAASDKDVVLVKSTSLESISNPKVLSSWLAGLAKAQAYSKMVNELRAEWIGNNGARGTSKAGADMEIGGYSVPAGMTLNQFENEYGEQIFADAVRSLESKYLAGRSYTQGVETGAPEEEFTPAGFEGEGMSFPPEEQ